MKFKKDDPVKIVKATLIPGVGDINGMTGKVATAIGPLGTDARNFYEVEFAAGYFLLTEDSMDELHQRP